MKEAQGNVSLVKTLFSKEALRGYKVPGVLQAINQLSAICILVFFMASVAKVIYGFISHINFISLLNRLLFL